MMNFNTWQNGIISAIEIFADENAQKRVWLEGSTETFSSWVEAYCLLFDDFDLQGFIETYCETIPSEVSANVSFSLKRFQKAAMEYETKFGDSPDTNKILADPEWHQVCEYARAALRDLKLMRN